MKILVTGGGGFIGSHIVDALLESGFDVIVIDNLRTGSIENLSNKATFYQADINSKETEQIIKKERPTILIHSAAQINVTQSIKDPVDDASINILGTLRLLSYAKQYGIKKVIFSSSCAVYGETENIKITEDQPMQPKSFYGISKYTAESYIKLYSQLHNLPYSILRYANVYGPRQTFSGEGGVIATFCNQFLQKKVPIIYGDGEQTRDFVYVEDVAKANLAAINQADNETINIGTSEKTSINTLFTLLNNLTSSHFSPLYKSRQTEDIQYSCLNIQKADSLLKWQPSYPLSSGLRETLDYYK